MFKITFEKYFLMEIKTKFRNKLKIETIRIQLISKQK